MFISGDGIKGDILKMGTIFNWEKEYFTMDEVSMTIHFHGELKSNFSHLNSVNLLP